MKEIEPADPGMRRWVLLGAVVAGGLGALGLRLLDARLTALEAMARDAQPVAAERALVAVESVLGFVVLGVLVLGAYLGWVSWRTLRDERFPPRGLRMLSDTPIVHGRRARLRGWAGLVLGALVIAAVLVVAGRAHHFFDELLDSTLKPTPYTPEDTASPNPDLRG